MQCHFILYCLFVTSSSALWDPRKVSTNKTIRVKMVPFCLKHMNSVLFSFTWGGTDSCNLLYDMQLGFNWGRRICPRSYLHHHRLAVPPAWISLTSLATPSYRTSRLAGHQGYIPYPHRAALCMFELVALLFLGHVRGSIGEHHLWARPCFSSSVLHV